MYDSPNNLVDLFEQSVAKWPNNKLFGVKNRASQQYEWTTYRQLADRVERLRGALAKLGVSKGDRVGIIADNCPEWFVCEQATHGLGAVYVPMYEKELTKVWRHIIADAEIKVLFVHNSHVYERVQELLEALPSLERVIVLSGTGSNSLSAMEELGARAPVPSTAPHWSELCSIIYTSGTTGDPKGVMLSHGNVTLSARCAVDAFRLDETMHVVAILPWAHVFGQNADLHDYIYCGGGIAFAESVEKLVQNLQETKPTGLSVVPRIVTKIYDSILQGTQADPEKKKLFEAALAEAERNRELPEKTEAFRQYDEMIFSNVRRVFGGALKFFVTGSAVLKPEIARFFRDIGQPTYDCYGMTETAPTITVNSPKYGNKYGSVGKPVPGMHVVIDRSRVGEESPDGEVVAYGAHVMMGYYNKPQATAEVMMPDTWNGFRGIRTGDRGRLDEDGYLHITGRFKDEYKLSNGKYVHPEQIENEIRTLPYVANAMLYGDRKDYNVALIVPNIAAFEEVPGLKGRKVETPEAAVASEDVREYLATSITAHLQRYFGGYEVPRRYLFVSEDFTLDNGLLTQTMKLKRFNILRKYEAQLQGLYTS